MDECSVCGRIEELDSFIKTCNGCTKLYLDLGDTIKLSKGNDKLDTLKRVIKSLFADAEEYITIDGE